MKTKHSAQFYKKLFIVSLLLVFISIAAEANSNSANLAGESNSQNRNINESAGALNNSSTASGPSSFRAEMSFGDALEILRNSTKPKLNIFVLWRDLAANADIYRDTPIGIDGVSGVKLQTHLKLLLSSLSAGSPARLGYIIEDGVIIIATENSLPRRFRVRIYYIADLVAARL